MRRNMEDRVFSPVKDMIRAGPKKVSLSKNPDNISYTQFIATLPQETLDVLPLKWNQKDDDRNALSLRSLQRRPPFPPGYVIRFLRKNAHLLEVEQTREKTIEELANGDAQLLRMLREAQADIMPNTGVRVA